MDEGAIAELLAAIRAQSAETAQLRAEIAAARPATSAARTVVPVSALHASWAKAKARLPSFGCDDARARRLLGIEPFVFGDARETWRPADGPFSGVTLGERDPIGLTGEDVDAFRVWFYAQTTRRKGPPSPATVNRYVMTLQRILNFAASRRTIPFNPLRGIDAEDEDNAREVVIEEEGFALILDAIGGGDRIHQALRAFVTLAYDSGMRRTELLCCRRSWLDDKRGRVHIPGAVAKNGEPRVTDLSPRAWIEVVELPRVLGTELIFANPETRQPYDGRWIHELFVRAVERADVTGRDGTPPRLHDLRRSFVTLMRRRGVAETVIMAKSGHKDPKVFRRYSIVEDADLVASFEAMELGRSRDLEALAEKRRGPARAAVDSAPADDVRSTRA